MLTGMPVATPTAYPQAAGYPTATPVATGGAPVAMATATPTATAPVAMATAAPVAMAPVAMATPTPVATAPVAMATATPAVAVATPAVATSAIAIATGPTISSSSGQPNTAPPGPYQSWPNLCDCFAAGNNLCLLGCFCAPCMAGQMYENVHRKGDGLTCKGVAIGYVLLMVVGALLATMSSLSTSWGYQTNMAMMRTMRNMRWMDPLGRFCQALAAFLLMYVLIKTRMTLRQRSNGRLGGSPFEDCLLSYFCGCCTTIQMARYMGWEDKPYSLCSNTGVPLDAV